MALVNEVWHGDSRDLCKRFQAKKRIQSVITDPPYGSNNQSNSAVTPDGKKYARKIAFDESPEIAIKVFSEVMEVTIPGMKNNSDIYIFTSYQVLEEWLIFTRRLLEPHGFTRKAILVWDKSNPGMGDLNSWGQGTEYILYYKRGNRPSSDIRRSGVLSVPQLRPKELIHPHHKPLPLLEMLIKHSTNKGDFIIDPFAGSGSTVLAAKNMNRSAIGIEYDEYNYKAAKNYIESTSGGFNF